MLLVNCKDIYLKKFKSKLPLTYINLPYRSMRCNIFLKELR